MRPVWVDGRQQHKQPQLREGQLHGGRGLAGSGEAALGQLSQIAPQTLRGLRIPQNYLGGRNPRGLTRL